MSKQPNSIKWVALLQQLRTQFADNSDQLPMLKRNKTAEDIVMGWVGAELYTVPPGAVLPDIDIPTDERIAWLWQWVPMSKVMLHAQMCTASSTMIVIDAVNWLINHGMIWPDGSVSDWVGKWRRANSQSLMAKQLRPIYLADRSKHEARLLEIQSVEAQAAHEDWKQKRQNQGNKP